MLLTEFVVAPGGAIHERLPEDQPCPRILVFGLEGEMFFGSTAALDAHFERIEERVEEATQVVVLRVKRARSPDAVGLTLLDGFLERLKARDVHVLLCGVRPEFADKIQRSGIADRLGERMFLEQPVRQTSTMLAIRHAYHLITSPCPTCPRRDAAARELDLYYEV
jgi:SulP family sulfate permease